MPTQPLQRLTHKSRSVGPSVALHQRRLQLRHLVLYVPHLGGDLNNSVLVGQITLVHQRGDPLLEGNESRDTWVLGQRLADVIDLNAFVIALRVGHEGDLVQLRRPGRQVNEVPVRVTPHGVEFGHEHDFSPLPEGPAHHLFSTVGRHLLWDDAETFLLWCARQRFVLNHAGQATRHNAAAKEPHIGFPQPGHSH